MRNLKFVYVFFGLYVFLLAQSSGCFHKRNSDHVNNMSTMSLTKIVDRTDYGCNYYRNHDNTSNPFPACLSAPDITAFDRNNSDKVLFAIDGADCAFIRPCIDCVIEIYCVTNATVRRSPDSVKLKIQDAIRVCKKKLNIPDNVKLKYPRGADGTRWIKKLKRDMHNCLKDKADLLKEECVNASYCGQGHDIFGNGLDCSC